MAFRAVVLGKTGTGKTYWLRNTLIPACPPPVWILDSEGDFRMGRRLPSAAALRDRVMKEMERKAAPSEIYTVDCSSDRTAYAFMRLFREARLPGVVIIDEVSKWCSATTIPDDLQGISKYGRKHGQSLVVAAQRPTDIHGDLLSQADCIISFRQHLKRDVRRLAEYGDVEGIESLDLGEYVALVEPSKLPASV